MMSLIRVRGIIHSMERVAEDYLDFVDYLNSSEACYNYIELFCIAFAEFIKEADLDQVGGYHKKW